MNKRNLFHLLLPLFFLAACNNNSTGKRDSGDTAAAPESSVTKKVYDIEPRLIDADSLQVLYYDNPDGDSLRYTRFFTYTETGDTAQVKALVQEMNGVYVQEPKGRRCRSEGKFYLLKGEDIVKTVYFSTRGDSCSYFYFIKDGTFIYFPLTERAATFLKENRQKAKKPKATASR